VRTLAGFGLALDHACSGAPVLRAGPSRAAE
jgi:hypothetical protein